MRDCIEEYIRGSSEFTRESVALAVGVRPDDVGFALVFNTVIHGTLFGEATIVPMNGGRYEVRRGEEGADAALRQSRRKVARGLRATQKAAVQAALAGQMTEDDRKREALTRQADRAELMAATIKRVRLQRKLEDV